MSSFDAIRARRQRTRDQRTRDRLRAASRAILAAVGLVSCVSCAAARGGERPDVMRGPCEVSAERLQLEEASATRRILNNEDVMDMVAKEIEEDVMIDLITECEVNFDVSAEELLSLSRGGASEAIIRAMVAAMRKG